MNLKKYIWLAALPMIFTACQEDMLVKDSTKQGITMLTATMGEETPDGRAQIELGGTHAGKFMWNEGDAFTMFRKKSNGEINMMNWDIKDYSDETPSSKADFITLDEDGLIAGETFVALYPTIDPSNSFEGKYYLGIGPKNHYVSLNEYDDNGELHELTEAEAWKKYFQQNMLMKTTTGIVGETSADTKVDFEHLCGLIRITYSNANSMGNDPKFIKLNGSWGTGVVVSNDGTSIQYQQSNEDCLKLHLDAFSDVNPVDGTRDFYILFFPPVNQYSDGSEATISPLTSIGINYDYSDNENYVYTPKMYNGESFSFSGFEAGKTYWFRITETGNWQEGYNLEWTSELEGGNEEEGDQPGEGVGEIVEVGSWEKLQNEIIYGNSSEIKFKDNIYLNAPLTITRNLKIDLNNYTLGLASGVNYSGKSSDAVITANAGLSIENGLLTTNDGTTEVHRFYIEGKDSHDAIHFNNVTLETGKLVKNAVSAGSNPFAMNNSTIKTDGYAIHWECNDSQRTFGTTLRNSTIHGNICYVTNKLGSLNKNDEVLIYECTIVGDLVTTLPNDVLCSDIFKMDEYSSAKNKSGDEWMNIGECSVPSETRMVDDWDDLVRVFDESKTSISHLWCVVNNDIELKHPLIAERRISLELTNKKLYVSESFDWKGENSVFIVNGNQEKGELRIDHGTVEGPLQLDCTGKNFFSNQNGEVLAFYEVTLDAKNIPTACYVENGLCDFSGSLNTIKASCAFDVKLDGSIAIEHDGGEVEGNILLASGSRLNMSNGSIKGNVTLSNYSWFYMFNYNGGGSIDGILEKDDTSGGTVASTVTISNDPNNTWSVFVNN